MKEDRPSLTKVTNCLYRYTQSYTDEALAKFQLSSGTYPFLLNLYHNEGISQNQISKALNVDKAMSARSIKRLIDIGYIRKEENRNDSRAYKLFLTDEAKNIIPDIINEIDKWIDIITEDISDMEKEQIIKLLGKILDNAKNHKYGKIYSKE
jgi:DNA-binding MarR family transcriptional regulator